MGRDGIGLVREPMGQDWYEFYPLGQYVVVAPGVCGGRPTFKGTRLEVQVALDLLAEGWSVPQICDEYAASELTPLAVAETIELASQDSRFQPVKNEDPWTAGRELSHRAA